MRKTNFTLLTLLWLLSYPLTSNAVELFGVKLNNINRQQLREAINNSGAEIIREAGDDNWFDIYNLSSQFAQCKQLFVGYDKTTATFAFAEYQLPYDYLPTMLKRLQAKYGAAEVRGGTFASDRKYQWLIDGVNITLQYDWSRNISRLVYSQQPNLQQLQQAYQQDQRDQARKKLDINANYF